MNSRAQSEPIGVILLVAVVVISVTTVGAFVLSDIGGASTTDADISVRVTANGFYFFHGGGDPLPMTDLLIVVRDGNRTMRPDFTPDTIYDGDDDDVFEPGERWANVNLNFDLETQVTVSLFDTRTNSLLVKETVYPDRFYPGGPTPPIPQFTVNRSPAFAKDPSTFDASPSEDPDGEIVSYTWTFGDDATATGKAVSHTYENPGTYNVTLSVEDDVGVVSTTTRTITVLPEKPQVIGVNVSNAPINQSDTTRTQTVSVRFDRPMNTSVEPAVAVENLTGTVSYGTGSWVNDSTYQQEVNVSDADEESIGRVNVTDGADETGDVMDSDDSHTFVVDTIVPQVSNYEVANPNGANVTVNFTVTEKLDDVRVTLTVQQGTFTGELTEGDFVVNETASGNYTYNTTYEVPTRGEYNFTLERAADAVANNGASGQSGSVKIKSGTGEPFIENFSAITASSDRDLVIVGNVTVEQYVNGEDLESVVIEVRELGNTTKLGSTTIDPAGADRISQEDVNVDAPLEKGTTYSVKVVATSTNGKSASQTENVTAEDTLAPGSPSIDAFDGITISNDKSTVTVATLNASDDKSVETVEFTVYNTDGDLAGSKTVSVGSKTANLSSEAIAVSGIKQNEEYTVEVTVYDSDGNTVARTERRTA